MNNSLNRPTITNLILDKIKEKSHSISVSEVNRGKKKTQDVYYSIKDIESVLNKFFESFNGVLVSK